MVGLNTWGLRSINGMTFNQVVSMDSQFCDFDAQISKKARNIINTTLRIHNATLNVLGYIPGISVVSGLVRVSTGASILGAGLGMMVVTGINKMRGAEAKDPKSLHGFAEHFHGEVIMTGLAQIGRGLLESIVPFGWAVNIGFDTLGTMTNAVSEMQADSDRRSMGEAHSDPNYGIFRPLQLV